MSVKPESRRQRRIRADLEDYFPGSWWVKIHGNEFMPSGLPDLVGTVDGLFFGFEVKEPDEGEASEIQIETIKDIQAAGGVSLVITESWQAVQAVQEARRLSAEGRHLFGGPSWVSLVLRATNRKNVDITCPRRVRRRRNRHVRSPVK